MIEKMVNVQANEKEENNDEKEIDSRLTIALEEFRVLQNIIENHDALFDKIRGWCITLIGAISVAHLSEEVNLSAISYIALSWFIIAFFAFSETVHRTAHGRALERSGRVENFLKNLGADYDGPMVRESLRIDNDFTSLKKYSNKLRFWVVWCSLVVIVIIISFLR